MAKTGEYGRITDEWAAESGTNNEGEWTAESGTNNEGEWAAGCEMNNEGACARRGGGQLSLELNVLGHGLGISISHNKR